MTEQSVELLQTLEQAPLLEIVEQMTQRIPVAFLCPHPLNRPATGVKREQIDTLKMLIAQNGYDGNKPLTVRVHPSYTGQVDVVVEKYEIIEGHHRWLAATELGFTELPCSVKELDDIEANLLLLTGNQQEGNDPLDIGLNALDTVEKSKGGRGVQSELSLSAFAKRLGKGITVVSQNAQAAKVYRKVSTQVEGFCATDRSKHLTEIHAAPESTWVLLAGLLQEHSWTVKETKAAVDRIRSVADLAPDWLADIASVYPKVAMEPGYAKSTAAALKTAVDCYKKLSDNATIYEMVATDETKEINGREHQRFIGRATEFNARSSFANGLGDSVIPDIATSERVYKNLVSYLHDHSQQLESWEPVRSAAEERNHQKHLIEMKRLSDREAFTPVIHQGDALDKLRGLPGKSFDLVCVDPPYNMDKADWDSYGSGKAFAEWARPWLKECQRVLKDSGSLYLFGINRMLSHIQHTLDDMGMEYRNWITWDTIQGAGGGLWVNRHESILYYSKTSEPYEDSDAVKLERHEENVREYKGKEYAFKNPSNVWRFPCVDDKHPERTSHPTQKPVELIERIILASSPKEGKVLDCFIGSGTTGVACMKHRRYCTGIEMNSDYVGIAQSRFYATDVGE